MNNLKLFIFMKNYLLKIAGVSFLCFSLLTSCSDDDSSEEVEDAIEETSEDAIDGTSEDVTQTFTDCVECPASSLTSVIESNDNVPITTATTAATVCRGEDGKAYLDGELNEDNADYETYLSVRQMTLPCRAITN